MELSTYPKLTNADTDDSLIRLWLAQKAPTSQKTYRAISQQFLDFTAKDLRETMLEDITLWLESFWLRGYSQNTINNKLAALKSLFSFGMKTGYLSANPARLIKTPKAKDALNERLMGVEEVKKLIAATKPGRDRALLKLLYGARFAGI